jgi:hypothetical protein
MSARRVASEGSAGGLENALKGRISDSAYRQLLLDNNR